MTDPKRMKDEEIREHRGRIGVRRGLMDLDALEAELERARASESKQAEQIKALADALEKARTRWYHHDGQTSAVRSEIDAALRLARVLK